jgi:hypothetical protein
MYSSELFDHRGASTDHQHICEIAPEPKYVLVRPIRQTGCPTTKLNCAIGTRHKVDDKPSRRGIGVELLKLVVVDYAGIFWRPNTAHQTIHSSLCDTGQFP